QRRQGSRNLGGDSVRIVLNLEIPYTDHLPASSLERLVLSGITGEVALDLLVPVAAPAARLPLAGMAVPKGAVHQHRESPAGEGNVDAAARAAPVTAPSAQPGAPERAAEQQLRFGVAAADRGHDSAATLARGRRRAERV